VGKPPINPVINPNSFVGYMLSISEKKRIRILCFVIRGLFVSIAYFHICVSLFSMQVIIIDLSCFFLMRIYKAWLKSQEEDTCPNEIAAMSIIRIITNISAHGTPIIAAQDWSPNAKLWQHNIQSNYRSRANSLKQGAAEIIHGILAIVKDMGLTVVKNIEYESDDMAATIAMSCKDSGLSSCIVSNSPRLIPLIEHGIHIQEPFGRKRTRSWCKQNYNLEPKQVPDLFAITGNSRVDGVVGIGRKRAHALLSTWENVETIVSMPECNDSLVNTIKSESYKVLTNKVVLQPPF